MKSSQPIVLPEFSDLHILVIGDVMIDRYILGDVKRISPEAPVPILDWNNTEDRLGGAANVALNLHALGAQTTLLSVAGQDENAQILEDLLAHYSNIDCKILRDENRKTTVKSRVVAHNQQLLRIDVEDKYDISNDMSDLFIVEIDKCHKEKKIQGIILQDYNKGMLTDYNIPKIIEWANKNHIATFVDPKEKNFYEYKNCTLFKPNKKELSRALGAEWTNDMHANDTKLRKKLNNDLTLITLSSEGLFISNNSQALHVPTSVRNISDVSGAGDTVISIVSLCYLKSMSLDIIGKIANTAGGQVCEKPGVVPVNLHELTHELNIL